MMGAATRRDDTMLAAALDYAARGWPVHPLRAGTKDKPTGKWGHNATTDKSQLREWFGAGNPRGYNILIATGYTLCVIDCDNAAGELLHRSLRLPATRTVRTPRGGHHYYYLYSADGPTPGSVSGHFGRAKCHGFDVRCKGGYVVAPPSVLTQSDSQAAGSYFVEQDVPVAELPTDVVAKLAKLDVTLVVADEVARVLSSSEGSRNDTLNKAAFALGLAVRRGLTHREVASELLEEAATIIGLGTEEIRATIRSGITAGMSRDPGKVVMLQSRREHPQPRPVEIVTPERTTSSMIEWKEDGKPTRAEANVLGLLCETDEWRHVFGYSTFHHRVSWMKPGPCDYEQFRRPEAGELLSDEHLPYIQNVLSQTWGHSWGKSAIFEAVNAVAKQNPHHELQDYLYGLEWDQIRRIDGLFSSAFAIATTPYESDVAAWSLIGAVARALDPGCQMDTMLVLAGLQGAKKTTFCQILAGEWFLSSLPDLHDKDAVQVLSGKWICEIGEMDAFRGKANSAIKDFLTRREDTFRPSYGRMTQTRPRSITFMGTTNKDSFLSDPTGNRRFLPVKIDRGAQLDDGWLLSNRDQLWAEAVVRYRDGEAWWATTPAQLQRAEEKQDDAAERDAWYDDVATYLTKQTRHDEVYISDVLTNGVDCPVNRQDDRAQKRVAAILRHLGWHRYRPAGSTRRAYRKRED